MEDDAVTEYRCSFGVAILTVMVRSEPAAP